jgi:hypothetical protein
MMKHQAEEGDGWANVTNQHTQHYPSCMMKVLMCLKVGRITAIFNGD